MISASSLKELDNFITTEFFHNPNIQNEKNVVLLGDFTTSEEQITVPLDFVWKWTAPKQRWNPKGWKIVICFAEYDKRDHSLQVLYKFPLWIQGHTYPLQPTNSNYQRSVSIPSIPLIAPSPSPPPILTTHSNSPPTTRFNNNEPNNNTAAAAISPSSPAPLQQQPQETEAQNNNNTMFSPIATSPSQPIPMTTNPTTAANNNNAYDSESIDKVLQKEKKAMVVPRPDGDSSSQPEDGPLFRATIASLEKRTGNLKMKTKKLLKRAMLVQERQAGLIEAQRLFLQSLKDAADTEIPGFQPVVHNYFENGAKAQIESLRMGSADLNLHVVEPLRRLYDLEIKSFDFRKREFDDESSQYYSWLSRYLSMKQEAKGKKKVESDSKYLEKRKAFELCRFDYYSYMQDLHGGRKQQDVTYELALYAESEINRFINTAENLKLNVKPSLDSIIGDVKDANKDWSRQRTEREVRRRQLERSNFSPSTTTTEPNNNNTNDNNNEPIITNEQQQMHRTITPPPALASAAAAAASNGTANETTTRTQPPSLKVVTNNDEPVTTTHTIQTPLEVETPQIMMDPDTSNNNSSQSINNSWESEERKKEGLLWAMSRPNTISDPLSNLNKAGWHKFWVVLAGGKLCEYTNWKQGLDLHNEPINLKVALVREARNAERRFCFEVVTPNYKRVYQATNEEDMHSWIQTINEAISLSLESATKPSPTEVETPGTAASNTSAAHATVSPKIQRVFSKTSSNNNEDEDEQQSLKNHKVRSNENDDNNNDDKTLSEKLSRKMSFHKPKPSVPTAENTAGSQIEETTLLETIRKKDNSNQKCADCNSASKVEWISINLLSLVCIDCSGIHRSLGTHISKMRSLRLDTVSFTSEVVELINAVSNEEINDIWESGLNEENKKLKNQDNRMGYITEKYVEKKFLKPLERPNAELREAVTKLDLKGILLALANRANPNMVLDETEGGESLLIYSLRIAGDQGAKIFPLTELLLLNSATLPPTIPNNLSASAKQYLAKKLAKDNPSQQHQTSNNSNNPDSSGVDKKNVGAKIQKRLSVGFSGQGRSVS